MIMKKIKDLTSQEIDIVCKRFGGDCGKCPLTTIWWNICLKVDRDFVLKEIGHRVVEV